MVQSKKKKKNADFSTVKLKVGKKTPIASNATNTLFKSQKIIVREQSCCVVGEKNGPTTRKNATLAELLLQMKHYKATVRKDTFLGLREIIETHPYLLQLHLGSILEHICLAKTDVEVSVRKELLKFIQFLVSSIHDHQLKPFMSLIVVHITFAMTHIRDDVRLDSLFYLDIYLEAFPQLFVAYSGSLLPNFIDLI
eukprot:Sdes_comp13847_c0_seq1m3312